MAGNVQIDGVTFSVVNLGNIQALKGTQARRYIRAGQVLTVERTGGSAPAVATFVVRSWLDGRPGLKVFGQPAASEFIDIESNTLGIPATQYVVPAGKVLFVAVTLFRTDAVLGFAGSLMTRLRVDGSTIGVHTFGSGEVTQIPAAVAWYLRGGQTLSVEREGGTADPSATVAARCCLEDVR